MLKEEARNAGLTAAATTELRISSKMVGLKPIISINFILLSLLSFSNVNLLYIITTLL